MATRVSDVVRGYSEVSSSLLKRWNALASRSAASVEAGTYTASSAARDTISGTTLAAEGAWLWAAWWWEALAKLWGLDGQADVATSQVFQAKIREADLKLVRLAKGPGFDPLPLDDITIECRSPQPPDKTEFRLRTEGSSFVGATYVGQVDASKDARHEIVPVWISIP